MACGIRPSRQGALRFPVTRLRDMHPGLPVGEAQENSLPENLIITDRVAMLAHWIGEDEALIGQM